jgi:hypothetical protein
MLYKQEQVKASDINTLASRRYLTMAIDHQLGEATGIQTHNFPTSTDNSTEMSNQRRYHSTSDKRRIPEFARVHEMEDVLKDAAVSTEESFAYPEPELALRGNFQRYGVDQRG